LRKERKLLCGTGATFASFLITTVARQDDPFLSGLARMIDEEECNSQKQNQSTFNEQLAVELKTLSKEYQHQFNKIQSDGKNEALSNIYSLIISIHDIPMLKEQICAINKHQQSLLDANEYSNDVQRSHF
jgi:hypothetical protein